MKGGARARSGPAPDPNALRRDRKDDEAWTDLPASGRDGPPPPWPLGTKASKRQAELWEHLWRKPQAIMWERRGQELEVALFVRRFSEAERANSPVNLSTWVKQMNEALGLSGPGLRFNRWRIVEDEVDKPEDASSLESVESARERLRVIRSDAG